MTQTPSQLDHNLDGIPIRTELDINNVRILNSMDRKIDGETAQFGSILSNSIKS